MAVGVLLWRRHRRRRAQLGLPSNGGHTRDSASTGVTKGSLIRSGKPDHLKGFEACGVQTYELDAVGEWAEVPLRSPRELPGSERERQRYQAVPYRPT